MIVERLFAASPEVHVLIVDDASPDGTGKIAEAMSADDPRVDVLHRHGKAGLGAAYIAGFTGASSGGSASSSRWTPTGRTRLSNFPNSWQL